MALAGIPLALFVLRIISPSLVLISSLSLFLLQPSPASSPSPITSVVVARRVPRRASILFFLTFCSLTYLGDGLTFIVYAIIKKDWPWYSGVEINALLGVLSFSGLAALGTWKDLHGLPTWELKRVRLAVAFSLILDIALVVLFAQSSRQGRFIVIYPNSKDSFCLLSRLPFFFVPFQNATFCIPCFPSYPPTAVVDIAPHSPRFLYICAHREWY